MCGIVGFLNASDAEARRAKLFNVQRGRDGFGYWIDGVEFKVPGETGLKYETVGGGVGLIACRAEPTTEQVPTPTDADQQPYSLGDWVVVHNGTIANDHELLFEYDLTSPTRIDSWVIVGMLNAPAFSSATYAAPLYAFADVVRKLVGSYAIIAHHVPSGKMFYATNYRPLYHKQNHELDGGMLSSVNIDNEFALVAPYTYGLMTDDGVLLGWPLLAPKDGPQRSLVVLSGGLDSTTVAAKLINDGHDVELLHFTYGCRAQENELGAVSMIADHFRKPLHVIDMTDLFKAIGHSRLTVTKPNDVIDNGEAGAEQAIEWVPARNTIMASVAIGIAEGHGFDNIALGINLEESGGGYTDNVLDLYDGLNGLMQWVVGVNKRVRFISPVGNLMKHEIVKEGITEGAPYHLTWSCYNPGDIHCGNCGPCVMRRRAFNRNGLEDPVFRCD